MSQNKAVISCFIVVEGQFQQATFPELLLVELLKKLREKGTETVHFKDRSVEVEGVYIPAKGSTSKLMVFSDNEEEEMKAV